MLTTVTNGDELHAALVEPFSAADLEWKVQTCGKKNERVWALVVPYLSARAIQARLDDVVGPAGWRTRYEPIMKAGEVAGFLCYLSLRIDGEWIEKCDGAELTDIEAVKGGISNALKRCAVQWGLGRYLYAVPTCWANVHPDGKERGRLKDGGDFFNWDPPALTVPGPTAPAAATAAAAATADAKSPAVRPAGASPSAATQQAQQQIDAAASAEKARAESFFHRLKQIDQPLCSALWKATSRSWLYRADCFQAVTEGCERALDVWGQQQGYEHVEYIKNESGWPWPIAKEHTPASEQQVDRLVDLARMTAKSQPAGAAQ